MSYLSIKQRFKAFLKGFKKCDLEKVIDFLKYVIHDYSEKPAKFMGNCLFPIGFFAQI